MKTAFITGFWGSPDPEWWRGRVADNRCEELAKRFSTKTMAEAVRAAKLAKELGTICYAYSDFTAAPFEGLDVVRMDDTGHHSHWRHKPECIAHALETHDAVVWIDLDAQKLAPLPDDFWEVLHARAPIQMRQRQYHRRKCFWRAENQNPRTMASAAFIYCRDRAPVLRAIDRLENTRDWVPEHIPDKGLIWFTEEHALMFAIDEMNGGWKGWDHYHQHHDPPWYTIGGEIFPCETPVFTAS